MKVYTFDGVYSAQKAHLTDEFIDREDKEPSFLDEMEIHLEAKRYATEFMENYAEYLSDSHRDDTRI